MLKQRGYSIGHSPNDHDLATAAADMLLNDLRCKEYMSFAQSLLSSEFRIRMIHLFECSEPCCVRKRKIFEKIFYKREVILGVTKAVNELLSQLNKLLKENHQIEKEILSRIGPLS